MVVVDKENFMGGTGIAHFEHVMMADEMHGMNRVYAKVTLKKGCSVVVLVIMCIMEMAKIISFFLERQRLMIIMKELYI